MSSSVEKLKYHGTGGEFFVLLLVNTILTVLTLGVYSFWARAKTRRYFYSNTELAGDRFAFHGTGLELLKGWLLGVAVMCGLVIIYAGFNWLTASGDPNAPSVAQIAGIFAYFATLTCLAAIAINGARRYRLSRSSWRGIRLGFTGQWQEYLKLLVSGTLLTIVTLGLYRPYYSSKARGFLVTHARFGTMHFSYDGNGADLFSKFLVSALLAIPTLGLTLIWYRAFEHRYFWSRTTIGPARFASTVTGGGLFSLLVTNVLLVVFTLGIGLPWAMTRWMSYLVETTELEGEIAWSEIEQQAQFSSSLAEGLAQGLDVNVDLGLGM